MSPGDPYPRKLHPKELDFLEGVLPPDRPGYRQYRDWISSMIVLAEGKRGPGNLILGFAGNAADLSVPLAPVVAFGMVVTTHSAIAITVRERVEDQIDVEIVSGSEDEVPGHFEEKNRWTYSNWLPGKPSPANGGRVREVHIDDDLTLVIAPKEKRIWVYDRTSGMNHLLPVTNVHNELMLYKGIRDPKIALNIGQFFTGHAVYSDDDLREAFVRYNSLRHRVEVQPRPSGPPSRGLFQVLKKFFGKESR